MNQRDKRHRRRYSPEGLPLDTAEWTVDDWRILYEAYQAAITKIAANHAKDRDTLPSGAQPPRPT